MKIGMLMIASEFTHSSPISYEMMDCLSNCGFEVVPFIPEHQLIDIGQIKVDCDLYILRPSSENILSIAGILHSKGARILNSYPACSVVRDKVQVAARLLDAGLPFPKSYVTGNIAYLKDTLRTSVIVKHERGANGEDITIIDKHQPSPKPRKGGYFVQQFLESEKKDIKLYVIGNQVMARCRNFPPKDHSEFYGSECKLTDRMRELALACGEIFDLEIYGLDCVQIQDELFIVDVNYFPSFLGVPHAGKMLADYIYKYALRSEANIVKYPSGSFTLQS